MWFQPWMCNKIKVRIFVQSAIVQPQAFTGNIFSLEAVNKKIVSSVQLHLFLKLHFR
jgi:hypothetical protein